MRLYAAAIRKSGVGDEVPLGQKPGPAGNAVAYRHSTDINGIEDFKDMAAANSECRVVQNGIILNTSTVLYSFISIVHVGRSPDQSRARVGCATTKGRRDLGHGVCLTFLLEVDSRLGKKPSYCCNALHAFKSFAVRT
jgi:hypothetical protein